MRWDIPLFPHNLTNLATGRKILISKKRYNTQFPQYLGDIMDSTGQCWALEQIMGRDTSFQQGIIRAYRIRYLPDFMLIEPFEDVSTYYVLSPSLFRSIIEKTGEHFESQSLSQYASPIDLECVLMDWPNGWDD